MGSVRSHPRGSRPQTGTDCPKPGTLEAPDLVTRRAAPTRAYSAFARRSPSRSNRQRSTPRSQSNRGVSQLWVRRPGSAISTGSSSPLSVAAPARRASRRPGSRTRGSRAATRSGGSRFLGHPSACGPSGCTASLAGSSCLATRPGPVGVGRRAHWRLQFLASGLHRQNRTRSRPHDSFGDASEHHML
jgi:hypothetical protein